MKENIEFYTTPEFSKHTLKKVQNRLLEMAKQITSIFDENKINYFIAYGTLLGAVRHGGFIPWDDDFDLFLFDESYEKAMNLLRANLPKDMVLECNESEPMFFHAWNRVKDKNSVVDNQLFPHDNIYFEKGLNVDLYIMKKEKLCNVPDYICNQHKNFYQRKFELGLIDKSTFLTNIEKENIKLQNAEQFDNDREVFCSMIDNPIYEIDSIFPLQEIKFENVNFKAPNNIDFFLTKNYGNYMMLPNIENRKPHYSSVKIK